MTPLLILLVALTVLPAAAADDGQLTRAPALTQFVPAPFPASEVGKTGSVVLAITIAVDGTVEEVTVHESAGAAFDAAAVEAARLFVFTPAEIAGKPSRIRILYRYDFVETIALPTTAIFAGQVMDRERDLPIASVTVTLADGRSTVTDAEGRFEFDEVPPGPMLVTLEGDRLTPLSTEETLIAGERLDATYEVFLAEDGEDVDDFEILVVAPEIKRQVVSTEIDASDARKVPGTAGDVLKVVENMPGVARASLGTGSLIVWGAAPDDTIVTIDDVPVPRLYHDGGLRSVVGSEFVRSVSLIPGGYGAANGRGLGGLVSVTTPELATETHGAIAADLYDVSGAISGPVGDGLSYAIGGRYGYVGPLLTTFYPEADQFFPFPNYMDAQARVGLRIGSGQSLDLTGLASSDTTQRTSPNPDPTREASESSSTDFQRVSLRYRRDLGDGTTLSAQVYGGGDQSSEVTTFGLVPTSVATDIQIGGARARYGTRLLPYLTAEAGIDARLARAEVERTGSVAVPTREGDRYVFGQPPPDQVSTDSTTVVFLNLAPYTELDLALLKDRIHLIPGLRFDPNARSISTALAQVGTSPTYGLYLRDPRLEPRLALRLSPSPKATITAAWGRYSQQPQAADLSAAFGNPSLTVSTATHFVLGAVARPTESSSIEATSFYTSSDSLAMRNPAEQPARSTALVEYGSGRTYGIQSMIRLDSNEGVNGWLSYTLSWSERRDAPWLDWRSSDYDQRHVLAALAGYALPLGFDLAVRARFATGYPRTEVVGAYYDSRRDLYQPLFGEHNVLRLPSFFQADARLAKAFELRSSELELSLEVQNLTNRSNVEEFVYDADYQTRGAISGLPILPVLGARWSF